MKNKRVKKGIIENKEFLDAYELLRQAHHLVKDIYSIPNVGNSDTMDMALENIHSALYLAEKISMNEAYPTPITPSRKK